MSIKIGSILSIAKGPLVQYTAQTYAGGSIGIRGSIQQGESLEPTETSLYLLREGSMHEVEILTDAGITGQRLLQDQTNSTGKKKERITEFTN